MRRDAKAGIRFFGTVAALLVGMAPCVAAQHPLVELPLGDPAYTQLDALVRQGCRAARVSPYRPYRIGRIQSALTDAEQQSRCAGAVLDALRARFSHDTTMHTDSTVADPHLSIGAAATLAASGLHNGEFFPLWRDVRPVSEGTPPLVGTARVRLTWDAGEHLVGVVEAYGETNRRNDPLIRAKQFRSTSGVMDFSEAYLAGQVGPVALSFGRGREAWLGDGSESLALSANGPPLDRISAEANWSRFELRLLFASVNDVVLDRTLGDSLPANVAQQRWHRVFVGHSLTYRASRSVDVTLGETALIGRQGGGVDLSYANPLMIYQVTQNDQNGSGGGPANLMAFAGVHASLGPAVLSGEWLIDDIQIDPKDKAVYPNLFGWRLEASYALPTPLPASVDLQYRRDDNYTYSADTYTKVYQQYDAPLGSELGPGADLVRLGGEVLPTGRLRLSGGIGRWRRGGQRLNDRPAQDRKGHAGEPFPSGTATRPLVQNACLGDFAVEWLDGKVPITVRTELLRVDHLNNQDVPVAQLARVQVVGTWRFRYP
jgi:hypothetical protein